MSKLKIFLSFFYLAILLPMVGLSMDFDREYIENLAKTHLESQIQLPEYGELEISVSEIDPRITINPCDTPLSVNIPENQNGRNVNIKISCESGATWRIFLSGRVTITVPVVVAKSNISSGSTLDDSNLEIIHQDTAKIRGEVYDKYDDFLGAKATKSISRGAAVSKDSICLVCSGENVTIAVESVGFKIKTAGIALENGALGEEIRVKNKQSGRIVFAQIRSVNNVVVIL